jgi:hypothetical protein
MHVNGVGILRVYCVFHVQAFHACVQDRASLVMLAITTDLSQRSVLNVVLRQMLLDASDCYAWACYIYIYIYI